jgi:hypothetical protein
MKYTYFSVKKHVNIARTIRWSDYKINNDFENIIKINAKKYFLQPQTKTWYLEDWCTQIYQYAYLLYYYVPIYVFPLWSSSRVALCLSLVRQSDYTISSWRSAACGRSSSSVDGLGRRETLRRWQMSTDILLLFFIRLSNHRSAHRARYYTGRCAPSCLGTPVKLMMCVVDRLFRRATTGGYGE